MSAKAVTNLAFIEMTCGAPAMRKAVGSLAAAWKQAKIHFKCNELRNKSRNVTYLTDS
jgi:hypothetical protein